MVPESAPSCIIIIAIGSVWAVLSHNISIICKKEEAFFGNAMIVVTVVVVAVTVATVIISIIIIIMADIITK